MAQKNTTSTSLAGLGPNASNVTGLARVDSSRFTFRPVKTPASNKGGNTQVKPIGASGLEIEEEVVAGAPRTKSTISKKALDVDAALVSMIEDGERAGFKYDYEFIDLSKLVIPLLFFYVVLCVVLAFAQVQWFWFAYTGVLLATLASAGVVLAMLAFARFYALRLLLFVSVTSITVNFILWISWFFYMNSQDSITFKIVVSVCMAFAAIFSAITWCTAINMEHAYMGFAVIFTTGEDLAKLVLSSIGVEGGNDTEELASLGTADKEQDDDDTGKTKKSDEEPVGVRVPPARSTMLTLEWWRNKFARSPSVLSAGQYTRTNTEEDEGL